PSWTTVTTEGDQTMRRASDAAVAVARDESVCVTYLEHDDDNSVGAIMFYKFDFSGGTPAPVALDPFRPLGGKRLYTWVGQDSAFTTMVTVDNNLPDFVDPDKYAAQSEPTVV